MKIPREIDELMWSVVEHDDEQTIEDFGNRYPDYRVELAKRVRLVRDLKGSRPAAKPPVFKPVKEVRRLGPSRLAIAGVTTLVIASIGFAAYSVAFIYDQRQQEANKPNDNTTIIMPQGNLAQPTGQGNENALQPSETDNRPLVQQGDDNRQEFDPLMVPVSLEEPDIMLSDLVGKISLSTGITINLAPGFQDARLVARYVGSPLIYVVRDLGQNFRFTPLVQTSTSILLVPAVDPNAPRYAPLPGSTVFEITGDEPAEELPEEASDEASDESKGNNSEIIIRPSNGGDGIKPPDVDNE